MGISLFMWSVLGFAVAVGTGEYLWLGLAGVLYERSRGAALERSPGVIAGTSFGLGLVGRLVLVYMPHDTVFLCGLKLYVLSLCLFHLSEFWCQSYYNSRDSTFTSNLYSAYLLNHSIEYNLAIAMSFVEYFAEYFVPSYFVQKVFLCVGLVVMCLGHVLRIGAQITAKSSFNHRIQLDKGDDVLVTWGFYSLTRHPSYVGWFIWSVGTQIMLCNPLCILLFYKASIWFFRERIQ